MKTREELARQILAALEEEEAYQRWRRIGCARCGATREHVWLRQFIGGPGVCCEEA